MWTWTLNWTELRPDFLVGSCPMRPEDLSRIREETAASAVLSLQSDQCLAHFGIDYASQRQHSRALGLVMRRVPMRDFDVAHQREMLARAVGTLGALLWRGHRVYVHCTAGLGRGPLVAVGYLTLCEGMAAEEAFLLVKSRRQGAVPSPDALAGCRSDLVEAHRGRIQRQAWRNYRERMAAQRFGDALRDWLDAERAVLAAVTRDVTEEALQPGRRGHDHAAT